jgi:hypothetical protein
MEMAKMDITAEFNAAAAAVDEEPNVITIGEDNFELPAGTLGWDVQMELARFSKEQGSPFQSEQAGAVLSLDEAVKLAFGAEQYQRVRALIKTAEQFMVVLNAITTMYTGMNTGESAGSVGSSRSTGGPQKRTSSATTGSTSGPASDNGNA